MLREEGNSEERKGFPEDVNFMVCPDLPQCVCTLHFTDSWVHFFLFEINFRIVLIFVDFISLSANLHLLNFIANWEPLKLPKTEVVI